MSEDLRKSLHGGVLALEIEDLRRILPHDAPNLLLDRVEALVPGAHAVGSKVVTGNEYGLAKRKHGFVFPATLALESLCQLALVVLRYQSGFDLDEEPSSISGLLAAVHRFEVHREMVIGERMDLSVAIQHRSAGDGEALVEGQALLQGGPFVDASFEIAPFGSLDSRPPPVPT